MLKRTSNPKSINFLQPINKDDNILVNTYEWLFNIGKYFLIVVQLVALGVFFSRFVLDNRNNDLTKDINGQVSILLSGNWKQNNFKYDNLQNLFVDIIKIERGQKINSVIIGEVRNGIPGTLNIENLSFNNGTISMNLETTDFQSFRNYESALKTNPFYENVIVSTTKDSTVYDIRINFTVKGK